MRRWNPGRHSSTPLAMPSVPSAIHASQVAIRTFSPLTCIPFTSQHRSPGDARRQSKQPGHRGNATVCVKSMPRLRRLRSKSEQFAQPIDAAAKLQYLSEGADADPFILRQDRTRAGTDAPTTP